MKTSGYFTPVRVVFWMMMLGCLAAIGLFVVGVFTSPKMKRLAPSKCITNQRILQQAVRSYQQEKNLKIGDPLDWTKIVGSALSTKAWPTCPIHGTDAYSYTTAIPPIGTLVAPCKDPAHKPPNIEDW